MAADMKLHVTRLAGGSDVDEGDFALFFSSMPGSKWLNLSAERRLGYREAWSALYPKFAALPSFWLGEVSWLKARALGDSERYVPHPLQVVHDIIGEELPAIDDALIEQLVAAMSCENHTDYAVSRELERLRAWLEQYRDWRIFSISWGLGDLHPPLAGEAGINLGERFTETRTRYRLQYRVGEDETWTDYRRSGGPAADPFDFDRWDAAHHEGQLGMWQEEYSAVRIIARQFTIVHTLVNETIVPVERKEPVWHNGD
jgi:hypothetical protein